jgi:hypothetical protein
MEMLFETYAVADRDALIRAFVTTDLGDRRSLEWWQPTSGELFAHDDIPSVAEVRIAYEHFGEAFRVELYISTAGLPTQ